jgi:riboflavin synthase
MFSGIVEEVGSVRERGPDYLTIEASTVLSDTKVSDSIAVSGVCLTVTSLHDNTFTADVMPETLRRSNLGALVPGQRVNLERAVTPSTRLGGHIVLGHVDGIGRIVSKVPEESAMILTVAAEPDVMRYVAMKGSVTVDGVSLTVARLDADSFAVSLVSYTTSETTLGAARPGQEVNLEVDVLARYIERLQQGPNSGGGITYEFLQEHGFM